MIIEVITSYLTSIRGIFCLADEYLQSCIYLKKMLLTILFCFFFPILLFFPVLLFLLFFTFALFVGFAEGLALGENDILGERLGKREIVGDNDGFELGLLLGKSDGTFDGTVLGSKLGFNEG